MLTGRLTPAGLPAVPITVARTTYEAVIDTGYDGAVQFPDWMAAILNPKLKARVAYQLADGSIAVVDTYDVTVTFDRQDVATEAFFSPNDEFLIGIQFLRDYRLEVHFPAGTVLLERMRP